MSSQIVSNQVFNKQEPIPGYVVKDLLGAGGFGEVWKAHAPGGLVKAIKFVYGNLNEKRASRELRSLNRIKDARHPFLLSIERIEVVDGNLLIVTELADQNLKQHYEQHCAKGLRGIPRDDLLALLRDAAEALDYIYENYSLQHLDIKPENLLLVGNRAKVADFGLVKNLYERSASLIEGLTPVYSPPELFDGKPSRQSDQYSLAIVYQEMLTGELPFDGLTAARLAAQHLQMPPVLAALPKCDQPIVARALSKNGNERFPSCRALIEALLEAGKDIPEAGGHDMGGRAGVNLVPPGTPLKTELLADASVGTTPARALADASSQRRTQAPLVDLDSSATSYGPVLIIGIGGIATRVMRRLRRRFCDRLGGMHAIPAIGLLLLDTDVQSLGSATEGEDGAALQASETLAMPLRRTEEYRSSVGKNLGSVSRRWLYNIPSSLQTDGFRPLGRLAMVDHSSRLLDCLRKALMKITGDENLATTGRNTGVDFCSRQPRVFIVGSISGGTGGGMLLDVAYAVRSILAELNYCDESVYGILMHATPRGASHRDKAVANAYATLNELWHYSRPGSCYPGDRSCGLPPFHGNNRTFSNCYYLHLGDDLTEPQLEDATDPVAEYLFCNALTPAVGFFENYRRAERDLAEAEMSEPLLRTFDLCQFGGSNTDVSTIMREVLCRDVVYSWRSGITAAAELTVPSLGETAALIAAHDTPKPNRFIKLDDQVSAKVAELTLDLDQLQIAAREMVDQELSADPKSYFLKLITDAFDESHPVNNQDNVARVFAIVDSVIGDSQRTEENTNETEFDPLDVVLETRLSGRSGKLAATICDWVFGLVDGPEGVDGAKYATERFRVHLRTMLGTASQSVANLREQLQALKKAVPAQHQDEPGAQDPEADAIRLRETQSRLSEYAQLRLEEIMFCFVTRWLRLIEGQVTAALDRLREFWNELDELAAEFRMPESIGEFFDGSAEPETVHSRWRGLPGALMDDRQELVAALDREIKEQVAAGSGKLRFFLTQFKSIRNQLIESLRTVSRHLILKEIQELNKSRLIGSREDPDAAEWRELHRCVDAAMPPGSDESAVARLLLILPENMTEQCIPASLLKESNPPTTIVRGTGDDLIVCREVEGLHVQRVSANLVQYRRDYIEIAKRLHTRIDVDWIDMSADDPRKSGSMSYES